MATLPESATWEAGIYQLEDIDPVKGGATGKSNEPLIDLANRTVWLKRQDTNHLGAGALKKNTIVTAKRTNGLFDFITGYPFHSGDTVTINASSTDPLVLTFSGGYDDLGPIVKYKKITTNQTISIVGTANKLLVATMDNAGAVAFTLETYFAPVYAYSAPSSPADGWYWYDLGNEIMYKRTSGAWAQVYAIILGVVSPGDEVVTYHPDNQSAGNDVIKTYGVTDVPTGSVHAMATQSLPFGFLRCNGAAVSRTAYGRLFNILGTTFGVGDGTTTFNLPDLRGEFIRGWDDSRGVDTDSFTIQATTTSGSANITNADTTGLVVGMSVSGTGIPGGATISSITNSSTFVISANATATANFVTLSFSKSRAFGSSQLDEFKIHSHRVSRLSNVVNSTSPTTATLTDWEAPTGVQSTDNVQPVGGSETRPRNIALNYVIKY